MVRLGSAGLVGALLLASAAPPAVGDTIAFEFPEIQITYDVETRSMTLEAIGGMDVLVSPGGASAHIDAGAFTARGDMTVSGGSGSYSVTGTFWTTDTDTTSPAFYALFQSCLVDIDPDGNLTIQGYLARDPGNPSLLVNRDSGAGDWVFAGTAGAVTIANPGNYVESARTDLCFSTGFAGDDPGRQLDRLFGEMPPRYRDFPRVTYSGLIPEIPAPGAVVLGLIGLGVAGWIARRMA